MNTIRKFVFVPSLAIVTLWSVAWLPAQYLPAALHQLLFWFGGLLTILLIPGFIGLWWSLATHSDGTNTTKP